MEWTITLTAQSLCLFTMQPTITETFSSKTKPTAKDIDKLIRDFALKNNVELDMVRTTVTKK